MPVVAGPDFEGRISAGADAALAAFLDLDDLLRRAVAYASESAGTDTSQDTAGQGVFLTPSPR